MNSRTSRRSLLLAGGAVATAATAATADVPKQRQATTTPQATPKVTGAITDQSTWLPSDNTVLPGGTQASYNAGDTVTALGSRWTRGTAGNEPVFTRSQWHYLAADNGAGLYVPNGWGATIAQKLAAAKAGTGRATVAVVGDSVAQGYYASNLRTTSFVGLLRQHLKALGGDGGSGFSGMPWSQTFLSGMPAAAFTYYKGLGSQMWGQTGSWQTPTIPYGPAGGLIIGAAAGATLTIPVTGTTIALYYFDVGDKWTYAIDGGTPATITPTGSASISTATITVPAGTHSVVITASNGNSPWFIGARGTNATGAVLDDYSRAGGQSGIWNNQDPYSSGTWAGGNRQPADLVIHELGSNDLFNTVTNVSDVATTSGSATIVSRSLSFVDVGRTITGSGIPAGTTVLAADPLSGATLSQAATATASNVACQVTTTNVADRYVRNVELYLMGVTDNAFGGPAAGSPDVLLLWPMIQPFADSPAGLLQQVLSRVRGLAESYGAAFLNVGARWNQSFGRYSAAGMAGNSANPAISGSDNAHPCDAGHAFLDGLLAPLVTALP